MQRHASQWQAPAGASATLENDAALLARFRQGERSALEVVHRLYVDRVERAVRRGFWATGESATEAADLVQEVFLRAFLPAARWSYDGVRDYARYLNAIVRNALADRCRQRMRECAMGEQALEAVAGAGPDPDHALGAGTLELVRCYLAGLPDPLRAVHEALNEQGLSQRSAAARLGISRQNVRTLQARLHQGLRQALRARRR